MDHASEAVFVLTLDGILLECNRRGEATHNRPRADIVGRHFTRFVAPEGLDAARASFRRMVNALPGEPAVVPILQRGGETVLLEFSASVITLDGEALVLAFARDVTHQHRERERARQAQKMEALGQLAGGVAHDFNNLMVAVLVNADILLAGIADDDPRREDVLEIRTAGERATALTRQLLAFGRRQVLAPRVVDLNEVVASVQTLLRRVLPEDIRIETQLSAGLDPVRVDRGQIEQVLINLAVNARDAMPRGGRLLLETTNVGLADAHPAVQDGLRPGPYVLLAVTDTGSGMPERIRQRVFEPFFTTKGQGEGTGLGLSTSYGIAQQSNGTLRVRSEVGQGSVFELYLPRVEDPVDAPESRSRGAARGGNETVLLLEDDPVVRAACVRVLERQGYTVLAAGDGVEALAVAAAFPWSIELLLADVVLPGMGGPEASQRLRASRKDLRVVYMSGFSEEAVTRNGVIEPGTRFLPKPFTPEVLTRVVREVLDIPVRA
jgi:PAS domain S-box-containing protein